MSTSIGGDDAFPFVDKHEATAPPVVASWRVLIVDDEPDVHQVTLMALKGITVEGRPLAFVHAYSAAEAHAILAVERDIAVVLLDVVMESDDAGLRLVREIREEIANPTVRIILRTGQPGYAPEIETIRCYDINDYKMKSELTRARLYTSLTVAVRSFWQLQCLEANRRGLELIIAATNDLSRPRGIKRFAEGVVTQLCTLLGVEDEGLVCVAAEVTGIGPYIVAAAGRFSDWIGEALHDVPDSRVRGEIARTLDERRHCFGKATCLYFSVPGDHALVAFVDADHTIGEIDQRMLGVFCSNISVAFENTQLYQRISSLAYEDQLLKLPNRNSFLARIDQRGDECGCLALIDIDGFADINSILDQDFGDAVLEAVAQRLRRAFPDDVTVARIGADTFGLLGPESDLNPARLAGLFAEPVIVGEETLRLSMTSGIVRFEAEDVGRKAVELLKNAGVALKQAKTFSRGKSVYFEKSLAAAARERMQLLSRLRQAFSAERLYLVYQPFVDLATGRIVGAETLLRWRTEKGEFVPPDRFIPLAEQSGLMVPIGDWVTRGALRFLHRLLALGVEDFRMAINVSHVQFREPDFVDKLLAAVTELEVPPTSVEIELTESVAVESLAFIKEKLSAVRAAGIAVAIDDFGTGYSSLNILRQMQVDRLKIDRAFVSGDDSRHNDYNIAGMVIRLADQLGLETVAEGIENQEQLDRLRDMGCGDGQGYHFSRPMAEAEFLDFVRSLG